MPPVEPTFTPFLPKTIHALAEAVTGGSANGGGPSVGNYRSASRLEDFFGEVGLELIVGSHSRVPAAREVLMEANRTFEGYQALKQLLEMVCDPADYLDEPDKAERVVEYLNTRLALQDLELRLIGKKYKLMPRKDASPVVATFSHAVHALDFESVRENLDRATSQAETDPEDAVTAACSTIESVCKCILEELGHRYPSKQDIQGLANEVAKRLNVHPSRQDLPKEIEADIRQILGGLQSVAGGIGALRTHGGDAHGRGKGNHKLDGRIARLAINAASTLALFFVETWQKNHAPKKAGKT